MHVSSQRLQQNFTRAAREYDARAEFQHVETRRVLDAALMLFPPAATVLDVGCGTGYFALAAREKRPAWNILGVDIAEGMCEVAASRCVAINADAARLPLVDASVDAAVSSLCYQWVADHPVAFTELYRVIKPGGRVIMASLGESSLHELRSCADEANLALALLPMRGFDAMKQTVVRAGFAINFAEKRIEREYYRDVSFLMDSMRDIGAGNNFGRLGRRLITPKRWAMLLAAYEKYRVSAGVPATWEHHFFVLSKPR